MDYELYTEDEIIEIGDHLKALKDKTIIDINDDFFTLKDYDIKSTETDVFNWFGKNEIVNMFYIDFITLSNGDEDFVHNADNKQMCSAIGVDLLVKYRERFINLRSNYLLHHKSPVMTASPNKSSNFKRR